MKRISALVGTLLVLAVLVPGAAAAEGSRHASADAAGTLPFSGLDVVLLVAGAGALVAGGLMLRRVAGRLR